MICIPGRIVRFTACLRVGVGGDRSLDMPSNSRMDNFSTGKVQAFLVGGVGESRDLLKQNQGLGLGDWPMERGGGEGPNSDFFLNLSK